MLENSLDAGSTNITVTVKQGGLKFLQIQDNGHGINKEDMDIVCERFTTSKLRKFEDLSSIATHGFRGEALASISYVSHLTIVTRTKESACAYKAKYSEGKLVADKTGKPQPPKPCAGNQGTQISVEDLFYNVPHRRRALKNANDELNRIADVMQRYAVHNVGVSLTLKKHGEPAAIVRTSAASSQEDNIRAVYGSSIAQELLPIKAQHDTLKFELAGFVTNPNYNVKKQTFVLFINHRSVHSTAIKKAVDEVYSAYLPRGTHCFAYLSLNIAPENVDVNVHPTKHEVHFLHEEEIVQEIARVIGEQLIGTNTSRTFYTQQLLPTSAGLTDKDAEAAPKAVKSRPSSGSSSSSKKRGKRDADGKLVYDHDLVRTDSSSQSLLKFMKKTSREEATSHRERQLVELKERRRTASQLAEELLEDDDDDSSADNEATNDLADVRDIDDAAMSPSDKNGSRHTASEETAQTINGHTSQTRTPSANSDANKSRQQQDFVTPIRPSPTTSTLETPATTSQSSSRLKRYETDDDQELTNPDIIDDDDDTRDLSRLLANAKRAASQRASVSNDIDENTSPIIKDQSKDVQPSKRAKQLDDSTAIVETEQTEPAPQSSKRQTSSDQSLHSQTSTTSSSNGSLPTFHPGRIGKPWPLSKCKLTSVQELRQELEDEMHPTFREILRRHVYVGCVDVNLSLAQHQRNLYLLKTTELSKELFYQLTLRGFAAFGPIVLEPAADVRELLQKSLDLPESEWTPEDGDKAELAEHMAKFLIDKAAMLEEYFAIGITEDGSLSSLPCLLDGHLPAFDGLALFLLRLVTEVNWDEEKPCFRTVAREIGRFYQHFEQERVTTDQASSSEANDPLWTVEHVLFPAFRTMLKPSKTLADRGCALKVADLKELYKVFERC
eukprot:TRINITY_DN6546_c0_g1_i1.p1 TRINITY_DN6546_c0_g1~~TRINITY_DN6546_c0_g1_i1.p1  ORF type:complete len:897 (+),score=246.67 TRINITY_DN6546_c0_g1_i1:3-2693(+)